MTRRGAPPAPATGDLFARRPPEPLTVLALTRALQAAVEPRFADVWVVGELANLRAQASGHLYFTLKDDGATLPAVLWASQARRLRFTPQEGTEVLARGRIEIYPPHGRYQLAVSELEPRGAGALAAELERVKARLAADGLLDPARRRPLPFLPRRVGVATSPTGAALRDFLRVLHARFPGLPVTVAPCRVQGEGAAREVAAAIGRLAAGGVDVVVVTRGGGSQEDLWAFNDEALARAIAACAVPVVSAVGHETDVTVADLVADARAATPTHAAQLVAPVRDDLLAALAGLAGRLRRAVAAGLGRRRSDLRALRAGIGDPGHAVSAQRHRLEDLLRRGAAAARAPAARGQGRLGALAQRLRRTEPRARLRALRERAASSSRRLDLWRAGTFRREALRLERLAARLEPANVARLLARGLALVLARGALVLRSDQVAPGEALRIGLGAGWLDATITARDAGTDPVPGREPGAPAGAGVDRPGRRG